MKKLTGLKKVNELEKLAKPLMKFLKDNFHPHCSILIDENTAKILEVTHQAVCKKEELL